MFLNPQNKNPASIIEAGSVSTHAIFPGLRLNFASSTGVLSPYQQSPVVAK
jgi:hypothetical protein